MEIKKTVAILPKEDCTGCYACANACPKSCIEMKSDENGFFYPTINSNACVSCSVCVRACPILSSKDQTYSNSPLGCYAAFSTDESVRFHSTSGGIFTHLAEIILEQNGFVIGAQYTADHLVEHSSISEKKDIEKLRQSKYVQSKSGMIYQEVQHLLKKGHPVLFVGTPCQCAALQSFLGKSYDHLLICDFICRGVNSPKSYLDYLKKLEQRYSSPVKLVWFKNKTYGWNHFATKIVFESGDVYLADRENDPFMLQYIKSKSTINMRRSCYQCRFRSLNHPSDITLGDFWGIEELEPELDTTLGVSAVIVNTAKGMSLFNSIRDRICFIEKKLETIVKHNVCLVKDPLNPTEASK